MQKQRLTKTQQRSETRTKAAEPAPAIGWMLAAVIIGAALLALI